MGTELMRVCVKEESGDELPSVPPGFESYASFTLKRVEKSETDNEMSCSTSEDATTMESVKMDIESNSCDGAKAARSLRRRPWINNGSGDDDTDDKTVYQKLDQNFAAKPSLPKGVVRGCEECKDCQKVIARWCPDEARRPDLEDAPVFYPSEEEFEDTLNYIAKIRPKAEQYGICRIVPPPSWKPTCSLKEKEVWEGSKFVTRVQRVDKLQNRNSMKKISKICNQMRRKKRKCSKMGMDTAADGRNIFSSDGAGIFEPETFGFEPGPEFTLKDFQKYANEFKFQYFRKRETDAASDCKVADFIEQCEPSIDDIEGEYWRIVERATEAIEVLYGADIETGVFGSGFLKKSSEGGSSSDEKYIKSGWNLNNFPRLPGSVLSYESSDISGVLVPWLYVGMCFSSFCWHVEDHHLYSLNYMHWGAPKMWYGVAGKDAIKLEEAMRKHLPDLFEEQPDLLHKLVTQLSPSLLKAAGVSVYRCVQSAGQFVLTFPRAYHAGFNCGFNCAEAVNVAPVDWLPHGQIAIELYCQQGRKTSISHDKLLLGAAREAVKAHWELNLLKKNTPDNLRWKEFCGKDGILAKALKSRVDMERTRREFLCNSSLALKMHTNFDANCERECCICSFDLHLSAAGCRCSPEKYSCLTHVKQLCSCPWVTKYFLFRYDIDELNVLVEALEGKLSSVYRWARQDLGLALSAHVSGKKMDKLSPPEEEKVPKDLRSQESAVLGKDLREKEISGENLNKLFRTDSLSNSGKKSKSLEADLFVKDMKEHSTSSHCVKPVKEEQDYESSAVARPCGGIRSSEIGPNDIILLSDDEDDEPLNPCSERTHENSSGKHLELKDRSADYDENINQHGFGKDGVSEVSGTNAAVLISQKDIGSPVDVRRNIFLPANDVRAREANAANSMSHVKIKAEADGLTQDTSNARHTDNLNCGKPNSNDKQKNAGALAFSDVDSTRSNLGTPSCSQSNSPERFARQKGPRIAKVVRRINCNVEPLAFGSVLSGKRWCNSRAIFPKGFRSRVRYMNVLDPTNMCHYVSEIIDGGWDGPLFMVYLEHQPSEVFVHVTATRCWDMVREKVNQEITKQHKAGKSDLPPLQPPGSLDGFEMFGFSSPAIVQAIEALDRNRVCMEYWDSRPYSRPQVQIPANTNRRSSSSDLRSPQNAPGQYPLPSGTETALRSLFRKANPTELHSLQMVLSECSLDSVTSLINEELRHRHRHQHQHQHRHQG